MKTILLTGPTGFLGSALARHWVKAGYSVSALIRPTSNIAKIEDFSGGIRLYSCSSDEDVLRAVEESAPEYIVHTACSYGRAGESLVDIFDVNVRLGLLLLEGAKRLNKEVAFVNTGTILDPAVSSYAMSKQSFSAYGAVHATLGGMGVKFINVALQHMYGPGDDKSKFTTYVISSCLANVERLRLTSGIQERDFIFIDDVISAYDTILSSVERIAKSETIEVGSGEAVSVRTFVELVHSLTSSRTVLEFGAVSYRANEAMLFKADISRMRSLGWAPATSLQTGIQVTINQDILQ
ncbi:NAD-dependent epimerase/dehydratase [Pseudomonas pergaminensis]|uniref:NAD-dependent epimerase/dehydratase n=1 Tax=Pseudomonas pergaminensis TaxID=2853159 RepID=A0ABD7TMF8_9PSED|nr:NAD-dependent epimerase/dehydratase [Pseudomonas pergaminensis]USW02765.1 NAD-dependent epimerase/dehydratase [Pseudomonas pergaminensis]